MFKDLLRKTNYRSYKQADSLEDMLVKAKLNHKEKQKVGVSHRNVNDVGEAV